MSAVPAPVPAALQTRSGAPAALSADAPAHLRPVALDDKYALESGRVYLTGAQALVRLLLLQRERDRRAGLNTGGFVSGYRGSPLGGLDQALWKAQAHLDRANIRFQPGVNEELAATSIWGTQQLTLFPGAKVDGVFGMWYGKGPGVDRCGDVFKHANSAGTSRYGGVLALGGDDHGAKSSTVAHQSDHMFAAAMMPVLYPASVQDFLDLGLHGYALSRYAGVWVGFKCVTDVAESSATVEVDPDRVQIVIPDDFPLPPEGISIRWPDPFLATESRLHNYKIYAALHYARANRLNRTTIDSPRARLGIVGSGKSYADVCDALAALGIDAAAAAALGIRVFKVAMPWPLEPESVREFATGLEEILVVEEKRQVVEYQLKEQLYNWRDDVRPRVVGKFDENGEWGRPHRDWLLPPTGDLSPALVARAIAGRIRVLGLATDTDERGRAIAARLARLETMDRGPTSSGAVALDRIAYFCAGCPHNTSTVVPEGSRATAGIGCHTMAIWMDRRTATFTQMGGEGAPWIGQAPFTSEAHVFANLGDGTWYHSGHLAIRAAVAAKVNITYKILYNDAVAMTGGQPVDGPVSPASIAQLVAAEGVGRICVVTDDPDKYPRGYFASGVSIHHRDELDAVQRELRATPGCTVLLYDQTCAAEKRRRRKRGKFPDPARRVVINELVCEGCGDCGVASNCVAIVPVDTEFGRKRAIDQSSCNKDFSCLKGLCPSFVTVEGGALTKPTKADAKTLATGVAARPEASPDATPGLSEPAVAACDEPFGILVTGIGGTGVVTIGALLGMAAHLEGKGCTVLDMTGIAQKNGAVVSHVRIGATPEALQATRIAVGDARLLLACDILTAVGREQLVRLEPGRTRAVVNTATVMPAGFTRNPDLAFPRSAMERTLAAAVGEAGVDFIDASRLATALMGDSIATNLFIVGYACQRGLLPVGADAILRAIELNGAAVAFNQEAFRWGRLAAIDPQAVDRAATSRPEPETRRRSASLDETIVRRVEFLTAYQDAAYAQRYAERVAQIRAVEAQRVPGSTALTDVVARGYFKLLAIKDEYEVARLYAETDFAARIASQFEGNYRLRFHLAPPLLARVDPATGRPAKSSYGPWVMTVFRLLARLRGLRGGPLDFFGRTAERRRERTLVGEYEALLDEICVTLALHNLPQALALARLPEDIRGFGIVKERNIAAAKTKEVELMAAFRTARAEAAPG